MASELTAVILPPTDQSFRIIAGIPLIRRTAICAQRAGFDSIVALGDTDGERLSRVLRADRRTASIRVLSREAARSLAGRVALIPSDYVLTPATLAPIAAAGGNRSALFSPDAAPDARIAVGPPDLLLASPETAVVDLPRASLDGAPLMRVCDAQSARRAEDRLVADLRAATVETDGPIARFDRVVSTWLSRHLVRTPLRPNHITLVGTAIGFVGAWALSTGTEAGAWLGTFLFWFAVILDGCDGEVARLKLQETRFGYLLDVTTDNIVHAAIFLGLGAGVYRASPDSVHGMLPVLLLTGFGAAIAATWFCLIRHPPVQRLAPVTRRGKLRKRMLRGFEALMNRDFAYLLVVLALFNRLYWFLWAAAFGTYAYAAGLAWVYRWRDAE